jgi:hypothetical protein
MDWGWDMSGVARRWHRIGVVLSVLWVLGFPFFAIRFDDQQALNHYGACLVASGISDSAAASRARCTFIYHSEETSFSKTFLSLNRSTAYVWGAVLAPVVALWVLGGIVIGTLRWTGRDFHHT